MSLWRKALLSSCVYITNLFANALGVISVELLVHRVSPHSKLLYGHLNSVRPYLFWGGFVVLSIFSLIYEGPIRNVILKDKSILREYEITEARKRLLNAIFYLNIFNILIWISASFVYYLVSSHSSIPVSYVYRCFFGHLFTGAITVIFAFFLCEKVIQRFLVPIFFPTGGLWNIPNVKRMTLRKRLILLLLSVNTIPFLIVIAILVVSKLTVDDNDWSQVNRMLIHDSIAFMIVGLTMTWLVGSSLRKALMNMVEVLRQISVGRFDKRVEVTTNDEIGYVGDSINEMAKGLLEREVVKELFGKYVSKEVRDQLLEGNIPLDGEIKEVTMLFSDLRNYTALVHRVGPKRAVKILNQYFEEMENAISSNGGVVIQFIGDEIEAAFGAPIPLSAHPEKALNAAKEMCRRLEALKRDLNLELEHGIGLHTGVVLAANIGSHHRLSYALVGDTVNIASRIQDLTKGLGCQILVSETTFENLKDRSGLKALGKFPIKGIDATISLYGM